MKTSLLAFCLIAAPLWAVLLLAPGCAAPGRYCDKFEVRATVYVVDDATFDEMAGGGVWRDGVCWTDTRTIYVRGGARRRPSDWIVGHEFKHVMYGPGWHPGETGTEER